MQQLTERGAKGSHAVTVEVECLSSWQEYYVPTPVGIAVIYLSGIAWARGAEISQHG